MNLAIVDISTKNHASLIENWIKVAQVNGWNVEIYVSTDVLGNIDSNLFESIKVIEYKGDGGLRFLNTIYRKYKNGKLDKVVITSLQSNYFSFLFSKIKKIDFLLTIHNVNAWNGMCKKNSLRFLLKYAIRKLYLAHANSLIVSSVNLSNVLTKKYFVNKKVEVMPFKLANEAINENKKEYVVYPGIISKDRKQYKVFLKLCQECTEINFVLLGRAVEDKDKVIVNEFKKLNNVITFDKYVTREDFDYYINRAAVIFGDLNVAYENDEFIEVYGETKDTGLSYFTVESRIPLLVNQGFENINNLQKMTFYYKSYKEAKNTLLELIENPEVYNLSMLSDYRLCNVSKRLSTI